MFYEHNGSMLYFQKSEENKYFEIIAYKNIAYLKTCPEFDDEKTRLYSESYEKRLDIILSLMIKRLDIILSLMIKRRDVFEYL